MLIRGNTVIRVGTSGYSFLDWIGNFYPADLPRGKMLDFYKEHFNTVEINSSYYSIPHPKVYENMVNKVPKDFEFFVKAHKSFTNERKDIMEIAQKYINSLKPLKESQKLCGILFQFPFSFKFNDQNLTYLRRVYDLFTRERIIVEFRHASWVREQVFEFFEKYDITYCSVDEPRIPKLLDPEIFVTNDMGYVRFHGRNRRMWWEGGGERYDYLYSDTELLDWAKKIEYDTRTARRVYLFFNNCHHGQAVKNARMMLEVLEDRLGKKDEE
jgi:uncharacterized protein YecE (DUF72 family)